MRTFQGTVNNLSYPILGKVIAEANSESGGKNPLIFITEEDNGNPSRCGLVLTKGDKPLTFTDYITFQLAQEQAGLAIGDIILLEPSGLCTVLFEQNSYSNSILLTERCDCRCLMCPQPPQKDKEDLFNLSLRLIHLMDPDTKSLGITGGEPTLAREGLKEVLSACRIYIPQASIQLLTNARSLKDYNKAKELADMANDKLFTCVSLHADVDALHDKIVSAKGAFWDTLEGIYNLERAGIPVELRIVITRLNYERLPQWAEFVYRTFPFAEHIAFMGMEPIGLAQENIDQIWIDPVDYMDKLLKAVRLLHRRNMNVSVYNLQLCTIPEKLWPFSRKAISEWKTIYLKECETCSMKTDCGGLFNSARNHKSRGIIPIKA